MFRLAGMCLAVGLGASAFAGPSVKSILEQKYKDVTTAFRSKDIGKIDALLTKDYTAVGPDGHAVDRKRILAGFEQQMKMVRDLTWPRTIKHLDVHGSEATAIVFGDFNAHVNGNGPKQVELIATTQDRWVNGVGGWKLKSSKLISSKMLLDGKAARTH